MTTKTLHGTAPILRLEEWVNGPESVHVVLVKLVDTNEYAVERTFGQNEKHIFTNPNYDIALELFECETGWAFENGFSMRQHLVVPEGQTFDIDLS